MTALRDRVAALKPTSGSFGALARNVHPRIAAKKARARLDWLRFARMIELTPCPGLVRLGSGYGGYVVPGKAIESGWACVSAGLGEDVTFELELGRRHGCTVHAFDPVPQAIRHVEPIAEREPQLVLHPYGLWTSDSMQRFYEPSERGHVSHSISNLQQTGEFVELECRSIRSALREAGLDRLDLLKLDIEGAEYAVLPDVFAEGLSPQVICVDVHRTSSVDAMAALVRQLSEHDLYPVHVYRTDVTLVAGRHLQ